MCGKVTPLLTKCVVMNSLDFSNRGQGFGQFDFIWTVAQLNDKGTTSFPTLVIVSITPSMYFRPLMIFKGFTDFHFKSFQGVQRSWPNHVQ